MPPVVGALVAAVIPEALAGTAIFGTLTVAGLVTSVATAGVTIGAALLLKATREQKQEPGHLITPTIQAIGPQPITPRYYAAGRIMAGGIQHLYEAPDGAHLLIGAVVNCEPIDGIEAWLVDGEDISNYFVTVGAPFPYLTSVINGVVLTAAIGSNVVYANAGLKWSFMYTEKTTLEFNGSGQPYFTTVQYPIGYLPAMCFEFGNGSPSGYVSQIAKYFWPAYWDDSFKCENLACIYAMAVGGAVIVNRFATYPRGFPQISTIIRAARIFDPRDGTQSFADPSTWKWSRNAVLILVWYMTHYDGARIPAAKINWASVSAEADYADAPVPTFGLTFVVASASGTGTTATVVFSGPETMTVGDPVTISGCTPSGYNGTFTVTAASAGSVSFSNATTGALTALGTVNQASTEARFSCDVQWNMGEPVKDVVARLQAACDATVWEDGAGNWNVWCAKDATPTQTLTDADISVYQFQELTAGLDEVNIVTPSYMEPRENYQVIPGVPASDSASVALVGERAQTLTLKEIASPDQAYRLAYRVLKRQNPPLKLSIEGGPSLLRVVGELVVNISSDATGISGVFRFTSKAKVSGRGERIAFDLAQVGADDYADVVMPYDPVSPVETSTVAPVLPSAVQSPDTPTVVLETISGQYYLDATATVGGVPPTDTQLIFYAETTPVNGSGTPIGATVLMPTILSQWVRQSGALASGTRYAVQGWFIESGSPSSISGTAYYTTPIPTPDAPALAQVGGHLVTATARIGGVAPTDTGMTWNAQIRQSAPSVGSWTTLTTSLSQWVLESGAETVGNSYQVQGWFSVGATNGATSPPSTITIV